MSAVVGVVMSYRPDSDNDLNEAYAVIPMPEELHGPADWWTHRRAGATLFAAGARSRDAPRHRSRLSTAACEYERGMIRLFSGGPGLAIQVEVAA
jgi:hypothetical protein